MKFLRFLLFFLFLYPFFLIVTLRSIGKAKKYKGDMQPSVWYEFWPDKLVNSYGKPSPFYARKGSGNNLLVYFCGGGVSWSQYSANRPMTVPSMMVSRTTFYTAKAYKFLKTMFTGILSDNQNNPFCDWNMVFIPYVTGDFHLGNNEYKYKNGKKTLYHLGERNTRLIMDRCKELFPQAGKLFICGQSAGAFGAAGSAPLVAGYYPDVPVTVYSDAGQLVVPLWHETALNVWRVNDKLQGKIGKDGDLFYNLIEYAYEEIGDRAVFLYSGTYQDDVLIQFGSTLSGGPHEATPEAKASYLDGLLNTAKRFENSGMPVYSFLTYHNQNKRTGLTQHTMCHAEKSLHFEGDTGISLSKWLSDAVNGDCYSKKQELIDPL